jgi:hypothetical protein
VPLVVSISRSAASAKAKNPTIAGQSWGFSENVLGIPVYDLHAPKWLAQCQLPTCQHCWRRMATQLVLEDMRFMYRRVTNQNDDRMSKPDFSINSESPLRPTTSAFLPLGFESIESKWHEMIGQLPWNYRASRYRQRHRAALEEAFSQKYPVDGSF